MKELWKQIPDFPDYRISNHGRVISYKRTISRILNPGIDGYGYKIVSLCANEPNKKRICGIHRLVLASFGGPKPADHEANHKDGIKTNNHINNLEW